MKTTIKTIVIASVLSFTAITSRAQTNTKIKPTLTVLSIDINGLSSNPQQMYR